MTRHATRENEHQPGPHLPAEPDPPSPAKLSPAHAALLLVRLSAELGRARQRLTTASLDAQAAQNHLQAMQKRHDQLESRIEELRA
jgi:hypothetical protein